MNLRSSSIFGGGRLPDTEHRAKLDFMRSRISVFWIFGEVIEPHYRATGLQLEVHADTAVLGSPLQYKKGRSIEVLGEMPDGPRQSTKEGKERKDAEGT